MRGKRRLKTGATVKGVGCEKYGIAIQREIPIEIK